MKSIFVHPEKNVIDRDGCRVEAKSVPYEHFGEDSKYIPDWELCIADQVRDILLPFFIKYANKGYNTNELVHVVKGAMQTCRIVVENAKSNKLFASIVTKFPDMLELCDKKFKTDILDDLDISSPKDYLSYLGDKDNITVNNNLKKKGDKE